MNTKNFIACSLVCSTLLLFGEDYNGIDVNIINSHANSGENVVEQGKTATTITYMQPKEIKIPTIEASTTPKVITVKKDFSDVFIYTIKAELDSNNNDFEKRAGVSGSFISPAILQKYNTAVVNTAKKVAYENKMSLNGTCIVQNDIYLSTGAIARLNCRADTGQYISILMRFVPNFRAYALEAKPFAYLNSRGGMVELDTDRSLILNYNGSSNNIASSVNTHMIEKSLATFTQSVASGMGQATNNVMEQLARSMTRQEVVISNGGYSSSTVQTNNTRRPTRQDVKDYTVMGLAGGIVEGVEKVMASIADNKEPWSYKINKDTVLTFTIRER